MSQTPYPQPRVSTARVADGGDQWRRRSKEIGADQGDPPDPTGEATSRIEERCWIRASQRLFTQERD